MDVTFALPSETHFGEVAYFLPKAFYMLKKRPIVNGRREKGYQTSFLDEIHTTRLSLLNALLFFNFLSCFPLDESDSVSV